MIKKCDRSVGRLVGHSVGRIHGAGRQAGRQADNGTRGKREEGRDNKPFDFLCWALCDIARFFLTREKSLRLKDAELKELRALVDKVRQFDAGSYDTDSAPSPMAPSPVPLNFDGWHRKQGRCYSVETSSSSSGKTPETAVVYFLAYATQ